MARNRVRGDSSAEMRGEADDSGATRPHVIEIRERDGTGLHTSASVCLEALVARECASAVQAEERPLRSGSGDCAT